MASDTAGELLIAEYLTPSDQILHAVDRVVVEKRTDFQTMRIVDTPSFGRALLLDDTWQSCELDEFIYHESLVHPGLLQHRSPRSVLILGGGEGATAREALRWRSVERVAMVDIDGEVVQACREHLPTMHRGAFDDPRFELIVGDAMELLETTQERWDVVISDLSDPIEEGPSFLFFTREYFAKVRQVLEPGGVFVVQAGSISPIEVETHARLHRTVAACFEHVITYTANVPSFGTPWSFLMACDHAIDRQPAPAAMRAKLSEAVSGDLRYVSGETLLGARQLPPYLERAIATADRVFTLTDPPKFGRVS